MAGKDSQNPYAPTRANDPAMQLIQLVIDWARANRNVVTSTEATNIGTYVTSILNGTYKI